MVSARNRPPSRRSSRRSLALAVEPACGLSRRTIQQTPTTDVSTPLTSWSSVPRVSCLYFPRSCTSRSSGASRRWGTPSRHASGTWTLARRQWSPRAVRGCSRPLRRAPCAVRRWARTAATTRQRGTSLSLFWIRPSGRVLEMFGEKQASSAHAVRIAATVSTPSGGTGRFAQRWGKRRCAQVIRSGWLSCREKSTMGERGPCRNSTRRRNAGWCAWVRKTRCSEQ
mmetsp:Transcript_76003/g.211127  ORF Transcript_76003/g.211127 Transcript_76003/m.211127 type:complete len:226 (+) Transcript_76003:489-1166(+)